MNKKKQFRNIISAPMRILKYGLVDLLPPDKNNQPLTKSKDAQVGVTVIIRSYERMKSLRLVLESILAQDLGGISLELIVCNNSARVHISKSRFSALGRTLRKFADVKLINFDYSWRTGVRYSIAALAKYDTVMFLDDDIILCRADFIPYMFGEYKKLRTVDILSCWTRLWTDWNDDYYDFVSLTFHAQEVTELTKCDVAGPGICMFNKQILSPKVIETVVFPEFAGAHDMGFSLIAALEHGSQCYFLPSYNMLQSFVHEQKETLMDGQDIYKNLSLNLH